MIAFTNTTIQAFSANETLVEKLSFFNDEIKSKGKNITQLEPSVRKFTPDELKIISERASIEDNARVKSDLKSLLYLRELLVEELNKDLSVNSNRPNFEYVGYFDLSDFDEPDFNKF